MLVDKLFRRDPPPGIAHGVSLQVDRNQKRVKVQGRNSSEVWASYDPGDFEGLQEGQTVVIAWSGGNAFVVRRVTDALPAETTLEEV